jgi:hypothetical protein
VIPHILTTIAHVFVPVPEVFAAVVCVLEPIASSAVAQRVTDIFAVIPHVLTPVADVLTTVPHVLATVANILAAVANILAAVAPVLHAVPDFTTIHADVLGACDGRGASHQCSGDRGHSEIAHLSSRARIPRSPSWRALLMGRLQTA